MKLKVFSGLVVVGLIGVSILLVLALVNQSDQTTGRVVVISDVLTVSPETDWLTIQSFGGPADSGVQELVFANDTDAAAAVTQLSNVIQDPPAPNAFGPVPPAIGTLSLQLSKKDPITGCPATPQISIPYLGGQGGFSWPVPAHSTMTVCGKMLYNGLGPVDGALGLTFVFGTEAQ